MRFLTNDLYEGAWLLSRGMELADLWIDRDARRTIVFEFHGEEIEHLKEDYKRGKAEANVLLLKRSMNELKDRMFALIREKRLRGGEYEVCGRGDRRAEEIKSY